MATPKAKATRMFKNLKRFWTDFSRCKRGVIGVLIIVFYIFIGLAGPFLVRHDPLFPTMPYNYAAGKAVIADVICKPVFYKYLPGGSGLSENMKLISDHELSSEEAMTEWDWSINTPNLLDVTYNSVAGESGDGAIEISYKREASDISPYTPYVRITHNFTYPYANSPRKFWIHMSYYVNGTVTAENHVLLEVLFYRIQESPPLTDYTYNNYTSFITYEDSLVIYEYPLHNETIATSTPIWMPRWIRSKKETIYLDPKYYLRPQEIVFPTSGNYTFEVKVSFLDEGSAGSNVTVYLDNLDVLLYGEVFGWLGTDHLDGGPRDNLTSLVYGARISIFIGLIATAISVSLGLFLGLLAGYTGGLTEEVIMRIADFLMCLPGLPLVIVLMVVLSSSIWNVILILSFLGWMGFARSIRSVTLSIRERSFIEAAKAAGSGKFRIIFKHILPNVFALVYIALATSVPGVVLTEATLSWLGLFDPTQISWGRMLNEFSDNRAVMHMGMGNYWFWVIPPGLAIALLAIAFILLGYSLDEILNPKLRVRR